MPSKFWITLNSIKYKFLLLFNTNMFIVTFNITELFLTGTHVCLLEYLGHINLQFLLEIDLLTQISQK